MFLRGEESSQNAAEKRVECGEEKKKNFLFLGRKRIVAFLPGDYESNGAAHFWSFSCHSLIFGTFRMLLFLYTKDQTGEYSSAIWRDDFNDLFFEITTRWEQLKMNNDSNEIKVFHKKFYFLKLFSNRNPPLFDTFPSFLIVNAWNL